MIMCTRENLLRGLFFVERAISRTPNLPILSHIILRPFAGKLLLSATDLDIAIEANIPAKNETKEPLALPFRIFFGFVNSINEENITLQKKGKNILISTPTFHSAIQYASAEDFPIIPQLEKTKTITFFDSHLADAFQQTAVAAATTETRPELTGVLFRSDGETITLAATDTFRLSLRTIRTQENTPFSLILPLRTVREIPRFFGEHPVEFSFTQNQCSFSTPDATITSRLIEGAFPDFQAIIPKNSLTSTHIQKKELLQKLEGASFFTSRLNDIHLLFEKDQQTITISAENNSVGSYKTTLHTNQFSGNDQEVAVNLKYFLDGLRGTNDDVVVLEVNGEAKPVVMKNTDNEKPSQYLLMPIRR